MIVYDIVALKQLIRERGVGEFLVACWLGYCVLCVVGEMIDNWRDRRDRARFERESKETITLGEIIQIEAEQVAKNRRRHARFDWFRRGMTRLRAKTEADRARAFERRSA